jgi:hypothetical protein
MLKGGAGHGFTCPRTCDSVAIFTFGMLVALFLEALQNLRYPAQSWYLLGSVADALRASTER